MKGELGGRKCLPRGWAGWLAALLFGAAAFLVRWSGMALPMPGTGAVTDAREVFVTLGAALSGPVGGALAGGLGGLGGFLVDGSAATIFAHLASGIWMGFAYKLLLCRRMKSGPPRGRSLRLALYWSGLVLVYYYVFLAPVFLLAMNWLEAARFRETFGGLGLAGAYLRLVQSSFPEFIYTTLITTLALVILPRRYRQPIW